MTTVLRTETLGLKQERFFAMQSALHTKAIEIGKKYGATVRGGDTFRDPRVHGEMGVKLGYGHKNSCHKLKLAEDIYFIRDGKIIGDGPEHKELHDWWDTQGGARRLLHDMNHYSLEHNGFR